jgi:hypothetical protein
VRALLHRLAGLSLALLVVLPVVGSELIGGEGGVWILPSASRVTSGTPERCMAQARATGVCVDLAAGLDLGLPPEMDSPLATITIRSTGLTWPLPTGNRLVKIPGELLVGLVDASIERADILLVDANLQVLEIALMVDVAGRRVTLYVF